MNIIDFVGGQFDNKHLLQNELSWRSGQPQKLEKQQMIFIFYVTDQNIKQLYGEKSKVTKIMYAKLTNVYSRNYSVGPIYSNS